MDELPQTPMLRGEKIWLRAMEKRDIEAFFRGRNDLHIGYQGGFHFPESMPRLEQWFDSLIGEQHGKDGFFFTICRLLSDEVVGFAWLWHISYQDRNGEFAIFLTETDLMGQGLGTDALNAVLDFGFNNLPLERVYLKVRAANKAAVRSYEKAGMSVEGTMRKATLYRGELVDKLLMAILREEWAARRRDEEET